MICLMEPLLAQSWRQPFQANGSSLCGENHNDTELVSFLSTTTH